MNDVISSSEYIIKANIGCGDLRAKENRLLIFFDYDSNLEDMQRSRQASEDT